MRIGNIGKENERERKREIDIQNRISYCVKMLDKMLIIVIVLSIFDEQDIESTGDKSSRLNVSQRQHNKHFT